MHGGTGDPWKGLRGNRLLEALNAHDALTIAPWLKRVDLAGGSRLSLDDAPEPLIYFPETAIVCLGVGGDNAGYQVGLVGREGAIGYEGLLGGIGLGHTAMVQMKGGTALVLPAARLTLLCARNATLAEMLLRFGQVVAAQVARTLVSNLCDPLDLRLSRWLLMFHDRSDGDELAVTHLALAALLNVRRATVTGALHVLEGDRLLRCTRGHIVVRDRPALEARAAHCYGPAEASYRAAIGRFGQSITEDISIRSS